MRQRDEHVIVEARLAYPQFCVDRDRRPEQDESLVHEMAPEVEQCAAPGLSWPSLGREAFEARIEASYGSERPVGHELLNGAEVQFERRF